MKTRTLKPYVTSRAWSERVDNPLLQDVAFNRHSMNDGHHVSPFDNARLEVGDDEIVVNMVQGLHPDFERVLSKATRATIGINLDDTDEDPRNWQEMFQGGLQTALESQVIVFEVSGVSRACTHQLVRSRRAAFHQQSMRASFYGNQPSTRIPASVWNNERARKAFTLAIEATHKAYQIACEEDISYQDARYILPEGTNNYIMLEYPLREFLNVYAYRACSMFQWEIVTVIRMCGEVLVKAYPFLEPYVKISCQKTATAIDNVEWRRENEGFRDDEGVWHEDPPDSWAHTCTFQGWEKVEGQCSFPWARESNRQFTSKLHMIG